MNASTMELAGRTRRVVIAQVLVGAVLAVVLLLAFGPHRALSVMFGVLIGLSLTLLLSRSVRRAGDTAETDPKRGMILLYLGAVQRFVFLIAAFALGLAVFGLDPLVVAAGFVAAQFAQLVNAREMTRDNEEKGLK